MLIFNFSLNKVNGKIIKLDKQSCRSWADEQSFALIDDSLDFVVEVWLFIFKNWYGDDVSSCSTSSS